LEPGLRHRRRTPPR